VRYTQKKKIEERGMCVHEKYINPFTDFGFKKIFGDTENTELLRSLINDILGLEGEYRVQTIIFKNGELLPDSSMDRKAIFDLYCEDEKGIKEGILEIAKNLLNILDNETIALKTGLSIEAIEKLR